MKITRLRIAVALATLQLLAACHGYDAGPIVGGPCSYETSEISATVTSIEGTDITLVESGGEEFRLGPEDFKTLPDIGDTVRFEKDSITEGTCTPFMYRPL
jgi:hypothetical protein